MKEGWEIKTLGEVCDIFSGSTPLKSDLSFWQNGDFPWFTIEDIRTQGRIVSYTSKKVTSKALNQLKVLPPDTILLCCTASVGEFAITTIPLTTNQQFNGLVIRNQNYLKPKYLYYFCSTLKETLLNVSGKTTIDFVSKSKIQNIKIPIPPLLEQQRIVSIIDKAFEAIDKAIENTQKNLQNSKELFESYLNSVFENGGEGWALKTVKDVSSVIAGQSPEGRYYNADKVGLPFYQGKKEFGEKYIKSSGVWTSIITKTAIAGDILMSVRAPVGPVNVSTEEICIGRGLAAIRQKDNVIHDFLFYFFKYYEGNIKGNIGAVFDSINKAQIENIPILIPPLPEQELLALKIETLNTEIKLTIAKYQQKLRDLEELKKSILNKAFAGEL